MCTMLSVTPIFLFILPYIPDLLSVLLSLICPLIPCFFNLIVKSYYESKLCDRLVLLFLVSESFRSKQKLLFSPT